MGKHLHEKELQTAATKEQLLGCNVVLIGFKHLFRGHGSTQSGGLLTSSKASAIIVKE